jgi:hypothetical protein
MPSARFWRAARRRPRHRACELLTCRAGAALRSPPSRPLTHALPARPPAPPIAGVAYVKYDRASAAALAIESLHEVTLNDGQGPRLKVMLADSPNTRCVLGVGVSGCGWVLVGGLEGCAARCSASARWAARPEANFGAAGGAVAAPAGLAEASSLGAPPPLCLDAPAPRRRRASASLRAPARRRRLGVVVRGNSAPTPPTPPRHASASALKNLPKPSRFSIPNPPPLTQNPPNPRRSAPPGPPARRADDDASADPDNAPPRSRLFLVVPKSADGGALEAELARLPGFQHCKTDLVAAKGVAYAKFATSSAACAAMEAVAAAGAVAGYKVKVMLAEPKSRRAEAPPGGGGGGAYGAGAPLGALLPAHLGGGGAGTFGAGAFASAFGAGGFSGGGGTGGGGGAGAGFPSGFAGFSGGGGQHLLSALAPQAGGAFGALVPGLGGGLAFAGLGDGSGAGAPAYDGQQQHYAQQHAAAAYAQQQHAGGYAPQHHGHGHHAARHPAAALAAFDGLGALGDYGGGGEYGGGADGLGAALGGLALGGGAAAAALAPWDGDAAARAPYAAAGAAPRGPAPAAPTARLFVVLHKSAGEEALAAAFRPFPGLEAVDLKRDRATGRSKGYAYVAFSSAAAAAAAQAQLDGAEFPPGSGCPLKVLFADPSPGGGGGSAGGASGSASAGGGSRALSEDGGAAEAAARADAAAAATAALMGTPSQDTAATRFALASPHSDESVAQLGGAFGAADGRSAGSSPARLAPPGAGRGAMAPGAPRGLEHGQHGLAGLSLGAPAGSPISAGRSSSGAHSERSAGWREASPDAAPPAAGDYGALGRAGAEHALAGVFGR